MILDQKDINARNIARRSAYRHDRKDDDRDFLETTLGWLLNEIAASRLSSGQPVTLVLFDFRSMSANLGPEVDLKGGSSMQGGLLLCNGALTRCTLKTKKLATTAAHEAALEKSELATETSVTYDPAAKKVHIRLQCLPGAQSIPLTIASQLDPGWATGGLAVITGTIDNFHKVVIDPTPLAYMLVSTRGATPDARIVYCDALYLYLRFAMGLAPETGFRLTTHVTHVNVKQNASQRTAMITCGTEPAPARELPSGEQPVAAFIDETHVSCISCGARVSMSTECGVAPDSFRHRHVEAVEA